MIREGITLAGAVMVVAVASKGLTGHYPLALIERCILYSRAARYLLVPCRDAVVDRCKRDWHLALAKAKGNL